MAVILILIFYFSTLTEFIRKNLINFKFYAQECVNFASFFSIFISTINSESTLFPALLFLFIKKEYGSFIWVKKMQGRIKEETWVSLCFHGRCFIYTCITDNLKIKCCCFTRAALQTKGKRMVRALRVPGRRRKRPVHDRRLHFRICMQVFSATYRLARNLFYSWKKRGKARSTNNKVFAIFIFNEMKNLKLSASLPYCELKEANFFSPKDTREILVDFIEKN